jgi:hypothetical protein
LNLTFKINDNLLCYLEKNQLWKQRRGEKKEKEKKVEKIRPLEPNPIGHFIFL